MKNIVKEIDGYLREAFTSNITLMDKATEEDDSSIKPSELSSLDQGIKRIQYRLNMAKTPVKYQDAFKLSLQLAEKFPMKQKLEAILAAIANSYTMRFGETTKL